MEQDQKQDDYFVFGLIEWGFRYQRPQHLSTLLSRSGKRVFYISSRFVSDFRPGFEIMPIGSDGRLFEVFLHVGSPPNIYHSAPNDEQVSALQASLGALVNWSKSRRIVGLLQHAFWCDIAMVMPNSRIVYDCIDYHDGFGNNGKSIAELELKLLALSDFVVTTSTWLDSYVSPYAKYRAIIRNGTEFELFSTPPELRYRDELNRKIIGYYGAIAEWFDIDLVAALAVKFSSCCILLIGADTVGAQNRLRNYKNIVFVGEVDYRSLPHYLWSFDVAILPFKVLPLTLATNPVKVYEYLSAGRCVVSVDLPEISQFNGLVQVGKSESDFLEQVQFYLNKESTNSEMLERINFAKGQTWDERCNRLLESVDKLIQQPKVSIVVVTFNNLEYTKACLDSIEKYSDYPNFEVIVVDNASSDGTADYLNIWRAEKRNRFFVLNEKNLGFSAANNQGLELSSGEYIILLNNDTYVSPGWIGTLLQHFKTNSSLGLLGPTTNNIGNEAKIKISYDSMSQMICNSRAITSSKMGRSFVIKNLAFFCVVISRNVFEKVGGLDESFGLGFFEDDDYCRRVEEAGFEIRCADDVFVHHHLSASFLKLDNSTRRQLFEANKKIYEAKWGRWNGHRHRQKK